MNQYPLPDGWRWAKLGDVCTKAEKRDPRNTPDVTFKYVDISGIDNRRKKIIDARSILGRDAPSRARQVVRTNDTIVATTRLNLNAVALISSDLDNEICSTGFSVLRTTEIILPSYLFSFVQTQHFIDAITDQVKGMLYPAVTDKQVREVLIPLPPLPEQRRIAAKIQELIQEVDRGRAACEKQLEAAKALPAGYLREIFESEEAKNWQKKKIGEVIREALPGFACGRRAGVEGVFQLRMNNISSEGRIDLSSLIKVPATQKQIDKYLLLPGDVIFNNTNSTELVGKSALFNEEEGVYVYSNHLTRLRTVSTLLSSGYLTLWLHLLWVRRVFESICNRWIGQAAVQRDKLLNLEIPLPPLPKQKRVVSEMQKRTTISEHLKSVALIKINSLDAIPQAILKRAFRGEL